MHDEKIIQLKRNGKGHEQFTNEEILIANTKYGVFTSLIVKGKLIKTKLTYQNGKD